MVSNKMGKRKNLVGMLGGIAVATGALLYNGVGAEEPKLPRVVSSEKTFGYVDVPGPEKQKDKYTLVNLKRILGEERTNSEQKQKYLTELLELAKSEQDMKDLDFIIEVYENPNDVRKKMSLGIRRELESYVIKEDDLKYVPPIYIPNNRKFTEPDRIMIFLHEKLRKKDWSGSEVKIFPFP